MPDRPALERTSLLAALAALVSAPPPRGVRATNFAAPQSSGRGKPGKAHSRHGLRGPAWAHQKKQGRKRR